MIGFILLAIVIIALIWLVGVYNHLVTLRNRVKNAWSQIDVQLQRRYDLIPNLVESVKGYMKHEKGTLESVIQARNQAVSARKEVEQKGGPAAGGSLKELAQAETMLTGAMRQIFALAENYPQLRASENMQQLQEELTSTENKVAFARQSYNDQVLAYNTAQEVFPAVLIASSLGHKPADLFETSEPEAQKAVKVQF